MPQNLIALSRTVFARDYGMLKKLDSQVHLLCGRWGRPQKVFNWAITLPNLVVVAWMM